MQKGRAERQKHTASRRDEEGECEEPGKPCENQEMTRGRVENDKRVILQTSASSSPIPAPRAQKSDPHGPLNLPPLGLTRVGTK